MRWTVLSGVAAWLAAAGLLVACADGTGPKNEQRVAMAPISFNEISGWADDKHAEALASFRRSCPKLTTGPDTKIATDGGFKTITQAEWKKVCDSAGAVQAGDDRAARAFFEENFRPLIVQAPGKFTGYFEPDMVRIWPTLLITADCGPRLMVLAPTLMLAPVSASSTCFSVTP